VTLLEAILTLLFVRVIYRRLKVSLGVS